MSVVAIDTSARRRLAVVLATRAGELIAAVAEGTAPTVGQLGRALGAVLSGAEVGAVAVVTGPGSYTGLRAGMAAGLGLAHARGIPLHGMGSLEVVAHGAPDHGEEILALADAGRGGGYAGRFARTGESLRQLGDPWRASLEALRAGLRAAPVVVSLDTLDLPGVLLGDPAGALARTVPAALSRPPLALARLSGVYLD